MFKAFLEEEDATHVKEFLVRRVVYGLILEGI
jgi:hypothetical protein